MEVWMLLAYFTFVGIEFDMTVGLYATEKLCLEAKAEKSWFNSSLNQSRVKGKRLECVSVTVKGAATS